MYLWFFNYLIYFNYLIRCLFQKIILDIENNTYFINKSELHFKKHKD